MDYDYNEKKRIVARIQEIKKRKHYIKLYRIINEDPNVDFTRNNNGIFFNINKLSYETLNKISFFLNDIEILDIST